MQGQSVGRSRPWFTIPPEQQYIHELEMELRQAKPRTQVSFALEAHLQQKAYHISHICLVLGVRRCGYDAQRRRQILPKALREQVHVAAAFNPSGSTCGSRRISHALRTEGVIIGHCRARTLIWQAFLRPVWNRRFVPTPITDQDKPTSKYTYQTAISPATTSKFQSDTAYLGQHRNKPTRPQSKPTPMGALSSSLRRRQT